MVATSFIGSQRLPIGSGGVILRSRTVVQPQYRVNTCYVARYLNGSATNFESAGMISVLPRVLSRLIPATIQCFRAEGSISSIHTTPIILIIIIVAHVILYSL